ncbi:MAG TPA: metalloregulator ArsR/SmtB family transcription factor [Thermodesulfovibrionales bacterium]|nr:metalloregulator ArsR/SmtB family transcription factor [Thermodesulfovibrionales bacterium]
MQDIVNTFKALSEETRLRILRLLRNGELCVCDLVAALDMIQPKVSFHLAVLKDAGFIKDRKQGKWIHYRLDDSDMFKRFLLLSTIERIGAEAVKEDEERLKEFLRRKKEKADIAVLPGGKICCGR